MRKIANAPNAKNVKGNLQYAVIVPRERGDNGAPHAGRFDVWSLHRSHARAMRIAKPLAHIFEDAWVVRFAN